LRLLQQAINRADQDAAIFDLNADGAVNNADILAWIVVHKGTLPGDANLDGVVDVSDWNIWNDHKFTFDQDWCSGDFTGDSVVDASDWNVWNDWRFRTSQPVASQGLVPTAKRLPQAPVPQIAGLAAKGNAEATLLYAMRAMRQRRLHRDIRLNEVGLERQLVFAELFDDLSRLLF
jgi:hypothetical protein